MFENFKVRCSAIGGVLSNSQANPVLTEKQAVELKELDAKGLLTEKQKERRAELVLKRENGTKAILSDTCIQYLLGEYAWEVYSMVSVTRELMDIPQMQKGCIVEQDSLILLSVVDGILYKPNVNDDGERERIYNEYLSGEIDAYAGDQIMGAEVIADAKSNWDLPTFLRKTVTKITNDNDWQIKGYMDISGAPKGFIANCLITTPAETTEGIKWRLLNKMNVATEESPVFKAKWDMIKRSMNFEEIPAQQRVFKQHVTPMHDFQRKTLYDKVKRCREWLNNFHERYVKINGEHEIPMEEDVVTTSDVPAVKREKIVYSETDLSI